MVLSVDNAAHDALANVIASRLHALSHDELRVVDVVVSRMLSIGRESYGPLMLDTTNRDWTAETAAELADAIFYVACRAVAANDARLERLRCEAADERAAQPVDTRLRDALCELVQVAPERPRAFDFAMPNNSNLLKDAP